MAVFTWIGSASPVLKECAQSLVAGEAL